VLEPAADQTGGVHFELMTVPLGHPSLTEAMAVALDNAGAKAARIRFSEADLDKMGGEFNWRVFGGTPRLVAVHYQRRRPGP
jgi:hypothetical protein